MARTLIGVVSSDANDKTITITVHERKTHPLYGKQYSRSRKFRAHDETNDAHIGDRVEITECRPISATKTWKLTQIIERSKGSEIALADEPVVEPKAEAVKEDATEEKES
jgi:small subunit ribosomal protein S17